MGGKKNNKNTKQHKKPSIRNHRLNLSVVFARVGNRLGCGERNYLEKTEINKHSTYISGVE